MAGTTPASVGAAAAGGVASPVRTRSPTGGAA